jgi:trehalose 6-phosphate synthase
VAYARGPDGSRIARRGGGGLVTALRGLVGRHDVTWIASAISEEDHRVAAEAGDAAFTDVAHDGSTYRLRLVRHDPAAYDAYYNVVANPTLWFLQHYLWDLARTPATAEPVREAWTSGYVPVNEAFATVVSEELARQPDSVVFFHDYHLYLAPAAVRAAVPSARLAHFVHIPWPQPDYWRVLPEVIRRAIHSGLLANDVVGFHTDRWRRSFLDCCEKLAGAHVDLESGTATLAGRTTVTRVQPISVDPAEFDELADDARVLAEEERIAARRPERLILRVDRTDPSKNVVRGFRAYELLLARHPELHGRIGMLALLDPSRQDIPEYADYLAAIREAADHVNGRFAREGWLPLEVEIQDNFPQTVAGYKQYDVLLVNAIFDGMNLVAKEAPLVNRRDGVLVLSENAGAHDELGPWAISINPFDVSGQADALYEALTMPQDERRRRIEAIRAHVRDHDVARWIRAQIADMDACAPLQ